MSRLSVADPDENCWSVTHDVGPQFWVLQDAGRWEDFSPFPIIIAADRDFQGLAHRTDGTGGFHSLNPLVALLGGSEIIPKVFLECRAAGAATRCPGAERHFRPVDRLADPRRSGCWLSTRTITPRQCLTAQQSLGADLPLFCHSATASLLKVRSYFLRLFFVGTASGFVIVNFHFCPLSSTRQFEVTSQCATNAYVKP